MSTPVLTTTIVTTETVALTIPILVGQLTMTKSILAKIRVVVSLARAFVAYTMENVATLLRYMSTRSGRPLFNTPLLTT